MTSQKLAGVLKSHWSLAVIAIAVAALAFAAGALASNRGAANEPTPAVGTDPTVPPVLYHTPTNEEFERALRDLEGKQAVSGNDDEDGRLGFKYTPPPSPVPRSTAESQFMEVPLGRALYFVSSDKVIFLPEDVKQIGWITALACYHPGCPEPPVTVLKRGEATVALDAYGNVVPYSDDTDDTDAFPFLKEHDE